MRRSIGLHQNNGVNVSSRWSWFGIPGFLFFLLKGLIWLLAPTWWALR